MTMTNKNTWMLPEGIDELLPEGAKKIERIRRDLLDLFKGWGYQYVIPPMVEYLEALLTGTGSDLALQTFKLTDQISGETLGLRADMTPQVARMASKHLYKKAPVRLCYLGSVLQARGSKIEKSRSPIQVGAEIYGSQHVKSDVEIVRLMLETLAYAGVQNVHLDLGHVGIFRGLAKKANLSAQQESELFDVLQRKATDEVKELLASYALDKTWQTVFFKLLSLNGEMAVLEEAKVDLSLGGADVLEAIEELQQLAQMIKKTYPALPLYFDLAELRHYQYQTGIVFAAFVPGLGSEVARGGRYDNFVGQGSDSLPATGFSADLKVLSRLSQLIDNQEKDIIWAPDDADVELQELIRQLRGSGEIVVQALPNDIEAPKHTRTLVKDSGRWQLSD